MTVPLPGNDTGSPSVVSRRWAFVPIAMMSFIAAVTVGFAGGIVSPMRSEPLRDMSGTQRDRDDKADAERSSTDGVQARTQDPMDCYQIAVDNLSKYYYSEPITEPRTRSLTYEAIKGLLGSLKDQFSSYLDPVEWQQLVTMTEGRFGEIGAFIQFSGGATRVARPVPGGPADKAGIRANDILIAIDGHVVKGRSRDELGQWIEGPANSKVVLEVMRGTDKLNIQVIRENIEPPVVEQWMEDDRAKIGHIVLTEFNRKSVGQLTTAYTELQKRGMRALVLDLRFNPGGLLDSAVDIASLFIPENSRPQLRNNVVIIHHGDGEEEGLTIERHDPGLKHVPLAVLVNSGSASAAEIVTGAIRDYGAGEIIGERTFGKGKVQTLFEMNHGKDGGIRLTTSLYYPPKRYDINFRHDEEGNRLPGTGGIVPDLTVSASPNWKNEFYDKVNDNQLHVAIEYLRALLSGSTAVDAGRIAMSLPDAGSRLTPVKLHEHDGSGAKH